MTGRDFKAQPHSIGTYHKRELSQSKQVIGNNEYSLSKNSGGFNNKTPTTTLGMAGAQQMLATNTSVRSQQPYSFKASIDQLEEEIMNLAQEVSFCKKEVQILKQEQDTVEEVSETQCLDIKRYLMKELAILDDVINKANVR